MLRSDENSGYIGGGIYSFSHPEVENAVSQTESKFKQKILYYQIGIGALIIMGITIGLSVGFGLMTTRSSSSSSSLSSYGNLTVYYAGSLSDIMNRVINPKFTNSFKISIHGTFAGSNSLSSMLAKGSHADILISADSAVNVNLMNTFVPGTNNKLASWYTYWTRTRLGIAYNAGSKYANIFQQIENGTLPWYIGLDRTIMKIGRTDPNTDPKGYPE